MDISRPVAAAAAIPVRVLIPAGVLMVDPMVVPDARVLVPQGDRVEGRVVNSVLTPVVIQWVALPVIAGPVMAVQVGLTTPGVRVQVMLGQAGQAG